jgi:two-component system OmpR family sensor kinase
VTVVAPAADRSWSGRLRRALHPGGWSLRGRLLGQLIALVAVACFVMVVVTEVGLQTYLITKLDGQLLNAVDAAQFRDKMGDPNLDRPDPPDGVAPPNSNSNPNRRAFFGGGPATIMVIIDKGVATKADISTAQQNHGMPVGIPLSEAAVLAIQQATLGPHPQTLDLGVRGSYRLAEAPSERTPGRMLVVGLSADDINSTLLSVGLIMLAVAVIAVLVTALAGELIIRYTLTPLRRVAATASRVAELPLERGEVALSVRVADRDTNPRTEVGQVGSALNRMLGHIANALAVRHASEMRVRKFVADASHELRTPLAAIRGYAELTRRSGDKVPPDIARAMDRVESESVRMTALVEDLLLLARLDAGRPLRQQPVDLTQLAVDSVSDAHVAGPDHKWRINVPDTPVIVPGDEPRLRQVLANLLANARTHTPAGTTVVVEIADIGDNEIRLSVTDDGPGIPAELLPEVFERFARGDSSRSRAAGSTGLGLSIVAAVVAAHRGSVTVTSRPGHTDFAVRLPSDL